VHSLQKANAIKKANGIICISENTKRDMIEFYPEVTNKNIKVIYIGVSDEYYQIEIDTSNKYYKYIKDRYIVFIGSRLYYKNFDLAVKAVSQINQARLFIIGGGPLNNDEKKILKKYLNNNYMHFIGLSNADINILYNYAYCLIYPSSYEGFGIPVIEAMKAGCPVVALNNSSIPEVSGNSAVLVSKLDVDVFSEAMLNFEDERFRNEIKTRGLVRARKFSWEKTYFETMTFYKQIIENQ
jgi:mannosyltransferase